LSDRLLPNSRDAHDIARRLREWLGARDRMRDVQLELAETLRRRSWDDMAAEVFAVMESSAR